jgi:hypothetical protein
MTAREGSKARKMPGYFAMEMQPETALRMNQIARMGEKARPIR